MVEWLPTREERGDLNTEIRSRAFQEFSEATSTIVNPAITKWKDQGGKVVGYFCSAFPDEVVTAAGLLPFRMRATGSKGTDLSDSFFSNVNCSFPRHVFNVALSGGYDFLDGLVMFNSCDNIRRVFDHWTRQMDTPFVHIMSLPRKAEPAQVGWFRDELANIRNLMQDHFEVEITDDKLQDAIRLHNQARGLLRKLYDLRKTDRPPITGAQALAVTVAGTAMPRQTYVDLLRELLGDLSGAEGALDHRARLMILGSMLMEQQGGLVVTDSLCFGSRPFWKDIEEGTDDPLGALAQYYVVDRPSCPRIFGLYEKRIDYITAMVRDFNVDGVVLERMTFCDLWGFEQFSIFNDFKEWGIPLLMLDQLRTRIQEFLETMGR